LELPERLVFRGARAAAGEWRCPLSWPAFRDTGPIRQYLVAFPRTSVRIRHEGARPFVTDATLFTMYNAGQRYTREAVHPAGDQCDWWSVDLETARAIARAVCSSAGLLVLQAVLPGQVRWTKRTAPYFGRPSMPR